MPKFSLVRILWDSEICRFWSRKCIFLLSFFLWTLSSPDFFNISNWASSMKFGMYLPWNIPQGIIDLIFWISNFSIFCDFWKLWDLVHSEVIHYISHHVRLFRIYFCIISMKSCMGLLYNFLYTITWIFSTLLCFLKALVLRLFYRLPRACSETLAMSYVTLCNVQFQ